MTVFYRANEKFAAESPRWDAYVQWAKIPNLIEIVSLDGMLCPPLITTFVDEDWPYLMQVGDRLEFKDLRYLTGRVANPASVNILAAIRNPASPTYPSMPEFEFVGYDLIEDATGISALTNCGGFWNSFSNDELNAFGLLDNFLRAGEVQRILPERNPGESHAECELYALWRLKNSLAG